MLPKKGRGFPVWQGVLSGRQIFAQAVSDLLRKEHGDSRSGIKQLMRQTHASERTVKHWLSAQHGPDTVFFLRLVASSPVIRAFMLGIIEAPVARRATDGRERVAPGVELAAYAVGEAAAVLPARIAAKDVSMDVPERDPNNDPDLSELNERQRWFLARVAAGERAGAKEIVSHCGVSLKTARRDIADLKGKALIRYVGSRRKGGYRKPDSDRTQYADGR